MKILGIETSCDDTGMAIFSEEFGILANLVHSQVDLHAEYGGVVPELASRDHIRKVTPLLNEILKQANITLTDIDAIAYTAGPGLLGSLMVGAAFAKSLAYAQQLPAIGIHHLEAHLLAPMLEETQPEFPFVALLVSGGHTMLVAVNAFGVYEILGESIDDAAGEAFDKTAKMMGFGYPGGPILAKLAEKGTRKFIFPKPMTDRPGLEFSFSGLKTHALTTYEKHNQEENIQADIALAFETAVVETLFIKCERALQQTGYKNLVVAGGVSANKQLRSRLCDLKVKNAVDVFYPRPEFCMDNGAMVAYAGYRRYRSGYHDTDLAINARARWPLTEI